MDNLVMAVFDPISAIIAVIAFTTNFFFTKYQARKQQSAARRAAEAAAGYLLSNFITEERPEAALIYGRVRVNGPVMYAEVVDNGNNDFLHVAVAFADHEISQYHNFYISGETAGLPAGDGTVDQGRYANHARIVWRLGTDDQEAIEGMVAETKAGTEFRGPGVAWAWARYEYDKDVWTGGLPVLTAVVDGMKILDTRTDTIAWSANPAMILRDFLIRSGLAEADEIDESSFEVAADYCDEQIAHPDGGTVARYECHYQALRERRRDIVEAILNSMAGSLWFSGGKWYCQAGREASIDPAVCMISGDDYRGPVEVIVGTPLPQRANAIRGSFLDASDLYARVEWPVIAPPAFLRADGGVEAEVEIDLPAVTSLEQAERIARIMLGRFREQITASITISLERGLAVTPGDTICLTDANLGWAEKLFVVATWQLTATDASAPVTVRLDLQETSQAVYQWDPNADYEQFDTDQTSLSMTPPSVGMTMASVLVTVNQESFSALEITPTTDRGQRVAHIEIRIQAEGEPFRLVGETQPDTPFRILSLPAGQYSLAARAVTWDEGAGEWAYAGYYHEPPVIRPANVAGFSVSISNRTAFFSWDAVPSGDLSHYQIRRGANWETASIEVARVARPGTVAALPARTGTYRIRAVSKTGAVSAADAVVTIAVADLPALGETRTRAAPPWLGTFINSGLVGTELRRASGYAGSNAYWRDHPSDEIDTGGIQSLVLDGEIEWTRHADNEGLWDAIPGDAVFAVDALFDDLTDADIHREETTYAELVALVSNDGESFGQYSCNGQTVQGRYVLFGVLLHSASGSVTPSVSSFIGRVSW